MNKLIFSNGGQPVFLEDLKLMQDNTLKIAEEVFDAVANGSRAFILGEKTLRTVMGADATYNYTVEGGLIVVDGEIYAFDKTEGTSKAPVPGLWLVVGTSGSDSRTFEDGETRECRETDSVTWSTEAPGSNGYEYSKLPTFADLLATTVRTNKPSAKYTDVDVTFFNGFSGAVQYRDDIDCYRVYINIYSESHEWDNGRLLFFAADRILNTVVSPRFVFRAENGTIISYISSFDGNVSLVIEENLPPDVSDIPSNFPVKIIFEIPK